MTTESFMDPFGEGLPVTPAAGASTGRLPIEAGIIIDSANLTVHSMRRQAHGRKP
jgi:hypothetical protein